MINRLLLGLICLMLVLASIPVAVIAFDAPTSPPPVVSMAESLKRIGSAEFPAPRQFRARDGASLQYYAYPAAPDQVAVLVHGSAGPGTSMHALAESLRNAGVTAYVLDIRGHGGSGRRGDIDYIGQIDDDLADFVAQLGPARSGETRTWSASPPAPASPSALPAGRMACCSTAMCFFLRSCRGRRRGVRARAAGSILRCRV